jgi:hypothetical protein
MAEARAMLEALLKERGLSSRRRLEIWAGLRALGTSPDVGVLEPLGVVVEVGTNRGLDVIAAYDDHQAMYIILGKERFVATPVLIAGKRRWQLRAEVNAGYLFAYNDHAQARGCRATARV